MYRAESEGKRLAENKMHLAQTTTTSFALSDLLGGFQMVALCISMLFSLLFCILAVTRCNYRFLITPPILALSVSLLMLGIGNG